MSYYVTDVRIRSERKMRAVLDFRFYHLPRPDPWIIHPMPFASPGRFFLQLHGNPVPTIIPLRTKLPLLLSYEGSPGRILGIYRPFSLQSERVIR